MTKVKMIHSVGDYVAGEEVELDLETADRWIVRGYAEGELSREFSDEELQDLQGYSQKVSV